MTNIKNYENTVTERLYDLMANINPCESCKFRGGTTDKCGNCCFWYPSEFVMGDESEPEKPTSDKDTLTLEQKALDYIRNHTHRLVEKFTETDLENREIDIYINAWKESAKDAAKIIKKILSRPDGQISYETRAKAEQFLNQAELSELKEVKEKL